MQKNNIFQFSGKNCEKLQTEKSLTDVNQEFQNYLL